MGEKLEELKQEANNLSVKDLLELAEFCSNLADAIMDEEVK